MEVSGVFLKAVNQKYCWPSSRCNYGIKLKIIHSFILELSHSQTWVSMPPAQQGVGKNLILLFEVSCRNYFLSSVYISQKNSSGDGGHPLVFTPCHKNKRYEWEGCCNSAGRKQFLHEAAHNIWVEFCSFILNSWSIILRKWHCYLVSDRFFLMLQEPEEKIMLFSSMMFKRRQVQTKLQPTFERKQTNKLHLIFEVSCSFTYQGGCCLAFL